VIAESSEREEGRHRLRVLDLGKTGDLIDMGEGRRGLEELEGRIRSVTQGERKRLQKKEREEEEEEEEKKEQSQPITIVRCNNLGLRRFGTDPAYYHHHHRHRYHPPPSPPPLLHRLLLLLPLPPLPPPPPAPARLHHTPTSTQCNIRDYSAKQQWMSDVWQWGDGEVVSKLQSLNAPLHLDREAL
jgi:hypothetical protein